MRGPAPAGALLECKPAERRPSPSGWILHEEVVMVPPRGGRRVIAPYGTLRAESDERSRKLVGEA